MYSWCLLICFSQRDLQQASFLPISVRLSLFSNSAFYEQAFMIFTKGGLASLVPCFEIKGSGLRLAALNILPVEAIGVAEVGAFGS